MYTKEYKGTEISATCCSRRSSAPGLGLFDFSGRHSPGDSGIQVCEGIPSAGVPIFRLGAGSAWVSFPLIDVHVISPCNFNVNSVYPGSM